MKKILAGLSGGVDSAAAVITLRDEGCAVDGATMVLHPFAAQEAEDARRTARRWAWAFTSSTGRKNSAGT